MKIALGAPVAEREWILPQWLDCLRSQTLQPDYLRFVYSESQDDTAALLLGSGYEVELFYSKLPFRSRNNRNTDPKDPWSAEHLAKLRNKLRTMMLATDADVFISLDTDILLEREDLLEQLVSDLAGRWDLMAGCVSLHPIESTCYNAGWFTDSRHGEFDQAWRRADQNEAIAHRPPIKIEIPMAFYAMKRHVLGMCAYAAHDQGEDIGFAQSLVRHGVRCGWRSDLYARHVWGPEWLEQAA